MTYSEKVKLLLFLINTTHDLPGFRQYLTDRVIERTQLTKEKNGIFAEIKELEASKHLLIKESASKSFVSDSDKLNLEIKDLEA